MKSTIEEIKKWYDKIHITRKEKAWRPEEAYSIFLDYLDVKSNKKLLDIGCGTGYLLKQADKRKLKTFGVDISQEGVSIAKKISPNSEIKLGNGENLPFEDSTFDYITCIGVLEHFLNIDKGIKEMVRVGKNSCKYCIVVPNAKFIYWKLKKQKGTIQQDINETLLSKKEWTDKFKKNGLEVLKVYHDRWPMKKIKIFNSINPIKIFANFIAKIIWLILPIEYTYQFVFICKKGGEKWGSNTSNSRSILLDRDHSE